MNLHWLQASTLLSITLIASHAIAQNREPEVRRALPAGSDQEIPTAPAVPFDPVQPPTAPAVPAQPTNPPANGNTEEIRISPQSPASQPDKVLLDAGNGFYTRKMYDLAAVEYDKYLRTFPGGPDKEAVLFRLAECYRFQQKTKAARDLYEILLVDYPTGEFAGYTAHRLGTIYMQDRNYRGALPLFQKAASNVKEPKIALDARFNEARALEGLGNRNETIQVYSEIIAVQGENPYRDAARRALAARFTELGRTNEALAQYEALSKEAEKPEARAEAAVKAATLATQMGQPEKAAAFYGAASKVEQGGTWRGIGAAGQLQMLYDAGKFKELVRTYNEIQTSIPSEAMASALILVGNAQRQEKQYDAAVATYRRIAREFAEAPEATQAAFQMLVCLYEQKNEGLVKEIDAFLAKYGSSEEGKQARLLKAEYLFNQDKFAEAGPLYLQLSTSSLDPKFRAEAVFKLAYCYAQVQNFEKTIEAYTLFIGEFRGHPLLPSAYLQRGIAYQKMKNYDKALTDYDTLILTFPKAKEREVALRQKALIFGQKDDNAQMVLAFQTLLKDYPQSPDAGQAWYWVGWAEFEQKKYEKALEPLQKAREADKEQYYARATLRIILCLYYLEKTDELAKEIDAYVTAKAMPPVPSEVAGWLGIRLLELDRMADAVRYLGIAAEGIASPEVYLALGRAKLNLGNAKEAIAPLNEYLKGSTEPVARARGLLLLGEAQIGVKDFTAAKKSAEQVLLLQPEGRLNAEGQMLVGDAEFAAGNNAAASAAYSKVAILYDDEAITPRALSKAAEAFRKQGKAADAKKLTDELQQRYPEFQAAP